MLTQEKLKELLDYDMDTGVFTWKNLINRGTDEEHTAGGIRKATTTSYRKIKIGGNDYPAHQLVFLYVDGSLPPIDKVVNHIDSNGLNNAYDNLEIVTQQQNCRKGQMAKNNTSGCKGVSLSKNKQKWRARIVTYGHETILGYFDNIEDAISARKAAEQHLIDNPQIEETLAKNKKVPATQKLTLELLNEHLKYNPETGEFIRLKTGEVAGSIDHVNNTSYCLIGVGGKHYRAHQLAFLAMEGKMPDKGKIVRHVDGEGLNNAWDNLEIIAHREVNRHKRIHCKNKSGVTGVNFDESRNKWKAKLTMNGKTVFHQRFDNFDEACRARKAAELQYGFSTII